MFPTIDYSARVSHFDRKSEHHDFRGFFVLFWVGLAIMVITTGLRNVKDTGYPLRHQTWDLMTPNVIQLGFSDAAMVLSTALVLPLHQIFRRSKGILAWNRLGMPIQSLFEAGWLALWVKWEPQASLCLTSTNKFQLAFHAALDMDGSSFFDLAHSYPPHENALLRFL